MGHGEGHEQGWSGADKLQEVGRMCRLRVVRVIT